jgi:SAM-dependent methyltransferase
MDVYIHGHSDLVLQAHRSRSAANSARHLLPLLKPGLSLLDVGCGEGWITRDLARLVAPGRVVGIDASAEVIERARAGGDVPDNLTFEAADLFNLGYQDGSFDVVHVHQVLHHLSDPVAAVRALARVGRPGGLISDREGDYGAAWWYPASAGWDTWQRVLIGVGRAQGEDLTIGRQLMRVAHLAGLPDFSVSASVWTYPGFEPAREIARSWAERLTAPRFVQLAMAAAVADEATLAAAARDIRAWAENPDAFFAHAHGEIIIRVPGEDPPAAS